MMKCARCSTAMTVTERWTWPVRCRRCGAVHTPDGEVISRPMFPITHPHGAVSPWMLPHTRPIQHGKYECRFNDVERPLVLEWDGVGFRVEQGYVKMRTFLSWRGVWG